MSRFEPGMNLRGKIVALTNDNFGAAAVLVMLGKWNEEFLNILDRLDIAGIDLYLLLNDVCDRNRERLAILLVLADAGVDGLNGEKLLHAARNRGAGLDVDAVLAKIDDVTAHVNQYLG